MSKWKDPEERGDFGAWLTGQVGERTFDWLAAEMAARGHVHDASYYRGMAGGSKPPGRIIRRALIAYFGGGPAPDEPTPAADLATALLALADELRLLRTEREAERHELEQLRAIVDRLAEGALDGPGTPVSDEPDAPREQRRQGPKP